MEPTGIAVIDFFEHAAAGKALPVAFPVLSKGHEGLACTTFRTDAPKAAPAIFSSEPSVRATAALFAAFDGAHAVEKRHDGVRIQPR